LDIRPKRLLIAAVLAITVVQVASAQNATAAAAAASADAKTYVPTLTFDVASIRQSPEANSYMVTGGFHPSTSIFRVSNWSYMNLLSMAYGIQLYQIADLPDSRAMFNIEAKSDSAADEKISNLGKEEAISEQRHMLQGMLADRFKLKTHWETREGSVFNLVVTKSGSKMKEWKGEQPSAKELENWGGKPVPPLYQRGDNMREYDLVAHGCSMDNFVQTLAGQFGRPVLDKTGLVGKYDFILRYHDRSPSDQADDDTNPVPTLDVAIQNQLGLKVETAKGPVQVLVIDHIEKPSEN
jgi:uncharacterized protein (TIGR03435 family)